MRHSRNTFVELVEVALRELPAPLVQYLDGVVIDVEPSPDRRACRDGRVDDPRGLLGLYHGRPLTHRSVEEEVSLPDRITLYQRNVERMCPTREHLIGEVRKTVLHEIGHHFGLDEDDLAELGYE